MTLCPGIGAAGPTQNIDNIEDNNMYVVTPRSYLPSAHPPLRLPTLSFLLPPPPFYTGLDAPDVFPGGSTEGHSLSASGTGRTCFRHPNC
jgi:hypothetical protein